MRQQAQHHSYRRVYVPEETCETYHTPDMNSMSIHPPSDLQNMNDVYWMFSRSCETCKRMLLFRSPIAYFFFNYT